MFNTDKFSMGILQQYEKMFSALKNTPVKYLEIGIFKGASLLWAKEFFGKKSSVIGIDKNISIPLDWPEWANNIVFYKADQNDFAGLSQIGKDNGPFDIIVDDGSHYAKETENSFMALWPHIKSGGYYVIEDILVASGYYGPNSGFKGMGELAVKLMLAAKLENAEIKRINGPEKFGSFAVYRKAK